MSVQLEPSEILSFQRPLTRMSKEVLVVRNPTDQDIAFKIKTTAPKLYCVRPNAGIVAAGGSQEVHVMLQPFKEEPPSEQVCKDKFLVQTVTLVDGLKRFGLAELWPHVESKAKGLIQQVKLRCCYISEMEKRIVDATPVETVVPHVTASKFEVTAPVESDSSPTEPTEQVARSLSPVDEMAKMRKELDAYRNELASMRARAPPGTAVESTTSKSSNVSWPLVVAIALLSFLVSYLLLKQSI